MRFCISRICIFIVFFVSSVSLAQVDMSEMKASDFASYGLHNKLGFTSWGKVNTKDLFFLTQELSTQRDSVVLAQMTRQVLTQKTFIDASFMNEKEAEEWLKVRLQSLLNLGFAQDVVDFVKQIPSQYIDKSIAELQAQAYLKLNNSQKACLIAKQYAGQTEELTKLNIICLALYDKKDKALMSFDLWQEGKKKSLAFVYGASRLLDLEVSSYDETLPLTIVETFLWQELELPLNEKQKALAFIPFGKKPIGHFKKAVDISKLLARWKEQKISLNEQLYKLYVLDAYRKNWRPDLLLIPKEGHFSFQKGTLASSSLFLWLNDKTKEPLTGADLLVSLWILSSLQLGADKALVLLYKVGFPVEDFVAEQLN